MMYLADEDTNSIPTASANRAIQGNVALQVMQPGGQLWKQCKWRRLMTNASCATLDGQTCNRYKWLHLVVEFATNACGSRANASGVMWLPNQAHVQGDPKIVKRGPNFWQKGDPKRPLFDVKGDLKFEFFRIVHKERIC